MHDVIRDMAILIALSEHGHGFLVKAGWELNVWPNDADEGCSAISLKNNRIHKLPEKVDISVLGELKELEILSLRSSNFKEFPKEIGNLVNLRLLDLSWNSTINIIPSKVISRLSRLEELRMQGSFGDWGSRIKGAWESNVGFDESTYLSKLNLLDVQMFDLECIWESFNAGFDELTCLSYLNILVVRIFNAECIPKAVRFLPNWEKFFICILRKTGDFLFSMEKFSDSDCLLVLDTTIDTLPSWFNKVVTKRAEKIIYSGCQGLNNLLAETWDYMD
ncbi:putative disease resistance protein [Prunus yedoensis var. nudiflora]|uniref:Putative disease resistance protein n=1 Tax=Prunus yedoensis var. nudiflora TaxID=2094558 RepID=A0A314XTH1_PRUYE|nr:putative disease resistance protein [Prunus yedoensis var. nudiflora]